MPDLRPPHTLLILYFCGVSTSPETLDRIKSSTFKTLISNAVPIHKNKTFFMLMHFYAFKNNNLDIFHVGLK